MLKYFGFDGEEGQIYLFWLLLKKCIYINGKTDEMKNALEFTVISQTTTCT